MTIKHANKSPPDYPYPVTARVLGSSILNRFTKINVLERCVGARRKLLRLQFENNAERFRNCLDKFNFGTL